MLNHLPDFPKQETTRVERSLSRFLVFAIVSLTSFIVLNTFLGFYLLAAVQSIVTITLPILYLWLKRGGSQTIIKHAIGLATLAVFTPLLFAPSAANTGIYWIFVYPLVAFFFLGTRAGTQWTGIYVLSLLAGIIFAYLQHIPLYYNVTQLSLSLTELLLCSILSYFFVSENEEAEKKQQAHVHYLKSVDHIERALHHQPEIEKGMQHALQALLETFHCSRAWLLYPCNPDASSWSVSFEHTVDEFPGALATKKTYPVGNISKQIFKGDLHHRGPTCYDDRNTLPDDDKTNLQASSIQSQMVIALQPNQGQPWLLGLHQCDYARHWNDDEKRLFQDIARRIEDALKQMLLYKDLKASTEELLKAKQDAEAASYAKSEFLSVMSHELRTPLHGIIGLQELIVADSSSLTSEQLEHLTLAPQAARSLSDLVNDVLNLSKVESGTIQLNHKELSLKNVLLDAIAPFIIACRNKHLPLQLQLEDVPEFIIGDEIRLRQILINLIGNAVKFTQQGHISIHIKQSNNCLLFAITDTGIGISSDMLKHLFEPFHQETQLMQSGHTGTGLGTTIAKRFVELMDGNIHVHSELGTGSCFTFHIPFEAGKGGNIRWQVDARQITNKLSPSPQINHQSATTTQRIHILLAEDDPIGQRIAAKRLKRMGMLVDIAEDGFTAWVKSQTGEHDLLLTDIRMPKMDGIELTRRIRQDEAEHNKPRLPIVGLSAHALAEVEQECSEAGMDAFMVKPINPDSVLAKVQEIINQHKSISLDEPSS
ncbi:MAG: ATP-binding protein [Mariprofundaceae bacterium]|nr:ATP-binding protein [Mariprofundaceae bacterium]